MRVVFRRLLLLAFCLSASSGGLAAPVPLGGELGLFVDRRLIGRLDNVQQVLGQPQPKEVALVFDQPWEKAANYVTVIKDGPTYRMYYRGAELKADGEFDAETEVTCYAESTDGITWTKPNLGLHEFRGSRDNNILLGPDPRHISHNFAVFLDSRPGVPREERLKAVGGVFDGNGTRHASASEAAKGGGLFRFVSADGIHWKSFSPEPIFPGYALDSLNCPVWVADENQYAIYLRTWSEGGTPEQPAFRGYRTISRAVSKDFVTWSQPERMSFGDSPPENLYTNGTHPYFRDPHLLVALGFRFSPQRQVIDAEDAARFGVHHTQARGVSDAVLLTSRGGLAYDRTFLESFIRPGPDPKAWTARNNSPALGVVPTGPGEMSIYTVTRYTMPDCRLQRYALRTDGFASIRAPYAGGSVTTKPLVFAGAKLVLNFATSSIGSVRVELLDATGRPLAGYSAADCDEIVGDQLDRTVTWRHKPDVASLAGRTVSLRFVMQDADLYSFQFQP
jgi:hypothetical protein